MLRSKAVARAHYTLTLALALSISIAGCNSLRPALEQRAVVTEGESWRTRLLRRPAPSIQRIGDELFAELARIVTGTISDSATRSTAWRVRESDDAGAPIPSLPTRVGKLLEQAFAPVPRHLLDSLIWHDSVPTLASPDVGIVVNRPRVTLLAWRLDSAVLAERSAIERRILVRPPGDWGVLAVLTHELAHLALDFGAQLENYPQSLRECAADYLAAFTLSAASARMSAAGRFELSHASVVLRVAEDLTPGEWISRDVHPDSEQRLECLNRGAHLHAEIGARERTAGSTILEGPRDSLYDAVTVGALPLLAAAIAEARTILSLPGEGESIGSPSRMQQFRELRTNNPVTKLYDTLLTHFDARGSVDALIGERLSAGNSLFPPGELRELRLRVEPPWKCASIAAAPGRARAIGCYAIGNMVAATMVDLGVSDAVLTRARSLGYSVTPLGAATMRDGRLGFNQWLLERGARRVLISIYREQYLDSAAPDRWSTRRVAWYSFAPLDRPDSAGRSSTHLP